MVCTDPVVTDIDIAVILYHSLQSEVCLEYEFLNINYTVHLVSEPFRIAVPFLPSIYLHFNRQLIHL